MSRAVTVPKAAPKAAAATPPPNYAERLAKYIPAEVVAVYASAHGIFIGQHAGAGSLWALVFICWALVPLYLAFGPTHDRTEEKLAPAQWMVSLLAFPLWVIALGGEPVMSWTWYAHNTYWGSLALLLGTFVFGLAKPKAPAAS